MRRFLMPGALAITVMNGCASVVMAGDGGPNRDQAANVDGPNPNADTGMRTDAADVQFVMDVPRPDDVPVFPPDVPLIRPDVPVIRPDVPVIRPDVQPPRDVSFSDVSTVDARDAFTPDVPPTMDGRPPSDVPTPTDAPPTVDAGPLSLAGRWRVVAWDTGGDAGITHVIDTNTTVTAGGVSYDVRVNGILNLASDRLSETFGILLNDHFFADDNNPDYASANNSYGIGAPGALVGDTFTIAGGTVIRFRPNPDGTISQIDASNGSEIRWARMDTWPTVTMIAQEGQAVLYRAAMSTAFVAPRVTLAWDRPGFAGGYTYTNDQAIAFGAFGTARYPITVTAPPVDAIGTVGTAAVAVAYILVYDDRNGNGVYDGLGSTDVLRGLSSNGIGYRVGATSMALERSSFRDLQPGLQLVHIHPDYSITRESAGPWDPTHGPAPDLVVNTIRDTRAVPDLLQ